MIFLKFKTKKVDYHDLSKKKEKKNSNSHNNGIECTRNNSVSNRDRVNLTMSYPSHMLTNLYCTCQLVYKENLTI